MIAVSAGGTGQLFCQLDVRLDELLSQRSELPALPWAAMPWMQGGRCADRLMTHSYLDQVGAISPSAGG